MEELGLLSPTLKEVRIYHCQALRKMPDLSGLTRLEYLVLSDIDSLEEVVGCLSPTLKDVNISSCKALRKMPDLSGLTRLDKLVLFDIDSLEEVGCLSPTLKHVDIRYCKALRKMPDLSGLTRLDYLKLGWNSSMEEVGGQYVSGTLKHLSIIRCDRMRSFPSLRNCVHLRELAIGSPVDAAAVVASSAPPNLRTLRLFFNDKLQSTSEQWEGLSTLLIENLIVEGSNAVRIDLGCLCPPMNLKSLTVSNCFSLEEIANSGELQGLERRCRRLKKLDGVRDIQTYNPGLKRLHSQRCPPSREGIHWTLEGSSNIQF
ncbi:hypothetical protein GOP47_0006845 [Adiantum capillus-veneris]|uniref:Uncharacterized protein n=1 Tax=Adiantum capillus-veneris TaxID=13818 RepID=A0A9D4V419_ADICA|nr:hypothetical protein GOP47_0006845 [Adiantum capillus-veneris]